MTDVTFSSEMTVKLVRAMAADDYVVQAAQVSAKGENNPDTVPERLIKALIAGKHGSPFEHNSMTFFVEVPIFIVREWMRHRMSSFNEMSGRYTELPGKFYRPSLFRPLLNTGTNMKPVFETNEEEPWPVVSMMHQTVAENTWFAYQEQLRQGVAREVARMVLPVSIYSQFYWTVNARSLMNFLSLRVQSDDSAVRSYPQYEIDVAAQKVEELFAELMPITHAAFVANGRVAP